MEKRKFKINYDQEDKKVSKKNDSYTFVIPNSNLEDIHISVSKDIQKQGSKREKKAQS